MQDNTARVIEKNTMGKYVVFTYSLISFGDGAMAGKSLQTDVYETYDDAYAVCYNFPGPFVDNVNGEKNTLVWPVWLQQ